MLTAAEILAGNLDDLTPEAQLALTNLVKRSSEYARYRAAYSGIKAVLAAAVLAAQAAGASANDIALGKALAAVVAKLDGLPPILVESRGTDTRPSLFTTDENWQELALDVLNVLYEDTPAMAQLFAVVARKVYGDPCLYAYPGELYFTARGPLHYICG